MRRDPIGRSGAALLARWRGAASEGVEEVSPPRASTRDADPLDEASALALFDAELERSVPATTAETVRRLLAAPRAALASAPTPANREQLLTALDWVEDFLDAALLTHERGADPA